MLNGIVTVKVPPTAGHLSVLRTAVGGIAARDLFTIDQIDDLRMAVEEAAVQLLRRARGERLVMHIEPTDAGLQVRLEADVIDGETVIDESSFSWAILTALSDSIEVATVDRRASVVLVKHRLALSETGVAP